MITIGVNYDAAGGPLVGMKIDNIGEAQFTAIVAKAIIAQLRTAIEAIKEWDDMDDKEPE